MRRFLKSHGAHKYNGKYNSRATRLMSKIHKGLDQGDVVGAFKKLEEESKKKMEVKDGR